MIWYKKLAAQMLLGDSALQSYLAAKRPDSELGSEISVTEALGIGAEAAAHLLSAAKRPLIIDISSIPTKQEIHDVLVEAGFSVKV